MSLTLEQLTQRTRDLAVHETGANYQTTRRIVRLTLAAIAEHLSDMRQDDTGDQVAQAWALMELLDVGRRALAGVQGKTARYRREIPARTARTTQHSQTERGYANVC